MGEGGEVVIICVSFILRIMSERKVEPKISVHKYIQNLHTSFFYGMKFGKIPYPNFNPKEVLTTPNFTLRLQMILEKKT